MHPIAERAVSGTEPIAVLVRDFYGPNGPLAEAGWDVRDSQREMSVRFAEQIDASAAAREPDYVGDGDGSTIGLIEAPCGIGKGIAYLVPGFLAALRASARWKGSVPNPKSHPSKLVVSTANIALQAQLIRKDIPTLGQMLGASPRAVLMKSRSNYVCRERLAVEAGSMFSGQDRAVQDVLAWTRSPGCDGDREAYPGETGEVWGKVSVGSDECGRQSCPHWDAANGMPVCYWRTATMAWPDAHIIVGNHHWVALAKGINTLAYAVDEAHELESALRGVQERRLTTSTFLGLSKRAAKLLEADPESTDRRMTEIATALMGRVERHLDDHHGHPHEADLKYRSPAPLPAGWLPIAEQDRLAPMFRSIRTLRDRCIEKALAVGYNRLEEGEIRTDSRKDRDTKESRKAANVANKLIELCRLFGAVTLGRPHPDWPSHRSPWAIWAQRERDGRDQWRVVVCLSPADVAPAFSGLFHKTRVMVLASATLPEFGSMGLSLGLGARWTGAEPAAWPESFATNTGPMGPWKAPRAETQDADPSGEEGEAGDEQEDGDGDPTSNTMSTPDLLAPEPTYARRLPSPYPLAQMGVLVVPNGPSPKDAAWQSWAVQQVVRAVGQSRGGALILATSNAMMNRYATALREAGRFTVIKQGEQGRSRTISAFRDDVDSVLVATRSFFQGLDVQGDSCRLVVIDKIPFASPEDPLENAVGTLLVERAKTTHPGASGASTWMIRAIPEAAMVLVQGIGRLIRSQADRGGVVLLDARILAHGDGWRVLREALPPFPVSRDLVDIRRVLDGEALQGALPPARPVRAVAPRPAIELDF